MITTPTSTKVAALVSGLLIALSAHATDYVVNSTADDMTANNGLVTLREAITSANSNLPSADPDLSPGETDGDTISFNVPDPSTLVIASELLITDDLIIEGGDALAGEIIIDAQGASRIFNVDVDDTQGSAHEVQLNNLTLIGGSASRGGAIFSDAATLALENLIITDSVATGAMSADGGGAVYNNGGMLQVTGGAMNDNLAITGSGSGGAIFNNSGTLNVVGTSFNVNFANRAGGAIEDRSDTASNVALTDVTMTGNGAGTGPATGAPGNGGGLHLSGSLGTAQISSGRYEGNTAAREGGALWNGNGTMNIQSGEYISNEAAGSNNDDGGGALFNNGGGTMIVTDATITDNRVTGTSGSGGGILNQGALTAMGLRISGNSARNGGGIGTGGATMMISTSAIWDNSATIGGGLLIARGTITVENTTLSGNMASNAGGGVLIENGSLAISSSTIASNSAVNTGGGIDNGADANVSASNTIIGDNAAGTSEDYDGALLSEDHLIIASASGLNLTGTMDNVFLNIDPQLNMLQDNGGTTQTHELRSISIAIDSGSCAGLSTDQRGFPRGADCDIGAFEVQDGSPEDVIFQNGFEEAP